MLSSKKGFTLIEMLVVIAIVSVLVSIVIPVVGESTIRAKAAADAANLRATYGSMNSIITLRGDPAEFAKNYTPPKSQFVKDCQIHILYTYPGFIQVYYVDSSKNYYSLDYFVAIAEGKSIEAISTTKPSISGEWYIVGIGPASE